ncbi:glycosyl transferase [Streptomyces carminius]|uniref:Glycosyl transferase n=1 Tax=Streptomyces carminius TaxID=2665496 RepID=A0A2M8M5U1_9ACTN|nr:glycosyl transferase [Streptomyces carminius]
MNGPAERPAGPSVTGSPDAARRAYRPRVLVLRALGLGDLLAGVPALRALRRAFPGHETVLAAPAGLAPLVERTGAVDTLLPAAAPGRAVPEELDWSGPPPDIAVDLHGNGPESMRPLEKLGPGRLLAFAAPDGPPWYAQEHERDRWCRFLRCYGIPADPADLRLPPPDPAVEPSPAPGAVLLHPGAGSPSRCWPVERYAAVARELCRAGHRVAVTGGPDERELTARLAELAGLPPGGVHRPASLDGLAALVADASAVVSGDTGIAHLAVALGIPSVTLFGPVAPRLWGPPRTERHRALWYPGPPGDPHARRPDPLLLRIRPEEVLAALSRLPEVRTV